MSAPAQKLSPSPVEDDGPRVADVAEGLGQLADELRVERVSPLGLVDRDAKNRSVPLDPQRAHARELRVAAC